MSQSSRQDPLPASRTSRVAAFFVHIFTAVGAGIALLALLEAVREHWAAMFAWLGLALVIDGLDGPIARRLNVEAAQPNWSGEVLDLVVDFVTYVFVPAYAHYREWPAAADRRAVAGRRHRGQRRALFRRPPDEDGDNHFRGFPALWNAAAFYLFLLHPSPAASTLEIAALIVLTFVPIQRAASGTGEAAARSQSVADRGMGCAGDPDHREGFQCGDAGHRRALRHCALCRLRRCRDPCSEARNR